MTDGAAPDDSSDELGRFFLDCLIYGFAVTRDGDRVEPESIQYDPDRDMWIVEARLPAKPTTFKLFRCQA